MTLPDLPPLPAILATLLAALLAGTARGFSGFGAGLIFIPLASAALGPHLAVPLLLLIDNVMALPLLPHAWKVAARREVGIVSAGALLGTPIGVWILLRADPLSVRWAVCAIAVGMLLLLASGWRYHGKPKLPLSLGVGVSAGVLSGLAQMGGPPVLTYWLGGAIPAAKVRGNLTLFFAIAGGISFVAFAFSGLIGAALVLALVTGPVYGAGIWLGSRLFGLATEAQFRRICFLLIALAAVIGLPLWDLLATG